MSRHDEIAAELAEKLEAVNKADAAIDPKASQDDWDAACNECGIATYRYEVALRNAAPLLLRERAALVDVERALRAETNGGDTASPTIRAALAALDAVRDERGAGE